MGGASQQDDDAITGINVTPFVDIALVLLIIFMVTAKYIVTPQAIPIDLPRNIITSHGVTVAIRVTVDQAGAIFVDTRGVNEVELTNTMRQRHGENPEVRVIIAADQRVAHGRVVRVMDLIRQAGVSKFAIETQPETAQANPTPTP
jgi:biopolymer transport protein TolR